MDYVKRLLKPNTSHALIVLEICISNTHDLKVLRKMQLICNRTYSATKNIFNAFYDIPYASFNEYYTERQLALLKYNAKHLKFHSSWFISISIHNITNIVKIDTERFDRIDCKHFHCPHGCNNSLSLVDYIYLMDERVQISDERRSSISAKLFDKCNIHHILPILLFKSADTARSHILTDSYTIFESYMVLSKYKDVDINIAAKYKELLSQLNDVVKDRIRKVLVPFGAINSLLENKTAKYIDLVLKHLGNSIYISDSIDKIYFVKHDKNMLEIITKSSTYIAVSEYGLTAYITTYCIRFISTLSGIPLPVPEVMLIGMYNAVLKLPPGISDDLTDLYGRFGTVRPFCVHVVVCYLFGINSSLIMVSTNAIINIIYDKLYEYEFVRLSNIIESLGGRSDPRYKEFRTQCITMYLSLRRYYRYAVLFLDILGVPRRKIYERFQPQLTEEDARSYFDGELKRCEEKSVGIWYYAGY